MSSSTKSSVWSQHRGDTADTMGHRAYLGLITLSTFAGVLFMMFTSTFTKNLQYSGPMVFVVSLGFLGAVFLGGQLINSTQSTAVALLGLALITGVTGLYLGPVLAQEGDGVFGIFVLAAVIVAVLGVVGVILPYDLTGWGRTLFYILLAVIACIIAVIVLGALGVDVAGAMKWLDWVILALFSVFVVYDFNRAMRLPFTAINAVNVSASVFLDYINIVLSLIGIGGDD